MSPTLVTFLFEVANFLVLAGVLSWLFFRPVRESLERRREEQKKQSDEAAGIMANANQMRTEIQQQYADLEIELEHRRKQTAAAAEQQALQIVQDARESAGRESAAAKLRLTHLERSQAEHLGHVIAETTGAMIDRLLRQLNQPELSHAMTTAACREIRSLEGNSLAPVRIESAHPLEQADRDALLSALGTAGESAEFHLIEELGMGLRILTNRGLVDLSSAGLSTFAQHHLDRLFASSESANEKNETDV